MTFCAACIKLGRDISVFFSYRHASQGNFHSTTTDLLKSASNCIFCKFLLPCIADTIYSDFSSHGQSTVRETITSLGGTDPSVSYKLDHYGTQLLRIIVATDQLTHCTSYLLPWADEASAAHQSGAICRTTPFNSFDASMKVIESWLAECESHDDCHYTISGDYVDNSMPPALPTRILDLGHSNASETIKLIETKGLNGLYVALSHCWGSLGRRPIQTRRETCGSHIQGIPIEILPRTFQDAIAVTRSVGVRYLWIDSLCIIQDDAKDWAREAKRMGPLYARAYITIAASGAHDSTEGLFMLKAAELASGQLPFFEHTTSAEATGSVFVHQEFFESPAWGPLIKRGWAMQEWRLSRRIIHFTAGGIGWKCREHEQSEYFGHIDLEQHPEWTALLEDYTAASFTLIGDRLIALEGLVSEMRNSRDDEYHFGIWSDQLAEHLCWVGEGELFEGLVDVPSWSWASTEGSKYFLMSVDRPDTSLGVHCVIASFAADGMMIIEDAYLQDCAIYHGQYSELGDNNLEAQVLSESSVVFLFLAESNWPPDLWKPRPKCFWILVLAPEPVIEEGIPCYKRIGAGAALTGPKDGGWNQVPKIHTV